jgi:hypothetical protein
MANRPLKKLIIDLLVSPFTVVPVVAGASVILFNWAIEGAILYSFFGFLGIVGGLGIAATKFIFSFDSLIEKAYNQEEELEKSKRNEDRLQLITQTKNLIKSSGDEQSEILFGEFIRLFTLLKQDIHNSNLTNSLKDEIQSSIEKVVEQCMNFIQQAVKYHRQASAIRKRNKEAMKTKVKLEQSKEKIITQIEKSLEDFRTMVESYHEMVTKKATDEISKMHEDLKSNLEVARRVKERMSSFEYDTQVKE